MASNVTPDEAQRLIEEEGYIYLDVRTEDEFVSGHPRGAISIPAFLRGPAGMVPNEEFIEIVERNLDKETPLVVGCSSGGRSAQACQLLEEAGYDVVCNCKGGFDGAQDRLSGEVHEGWRELDLPVETGGGALS